MTHGLPFHRVRGAARKEPREQCRENRKMCDWNAWERHTAWLLFYPTIKVKLRLWPLTINKTRHLSHTQIDAGATSTGHHPEQERTRALGFV